MNAFIIGPRITSLSTGFDFFKIMDSTKLCVLRQDH